MSDHIWIVRNRTGAAIGVSVISGEDALSEAYLVHPIPDDVNRVLSCDTVNDPMGDYEHNGYTLTRTPLPPRADELVSNPYQLPDPVAAVVQAAEAWADWRGADGSDPMPTDLALIDAVRAMREAR